MRYPLFTTLAAAAALIVIGPIAANAMPHTGRPPHALFGNPRACGADRRDSEPRHRTAPIKTIRFAGYEWTVRRAGNAGPGPNQWDDANVWVDDRGWLHLKISHVQGEWRCAELQSRERFGFGYYQFQVIGPVDTLDPNVVLGLFKYPTRDVGKDGTNEIDIEFARWGHEKANNGDYVVYPAFGERDRAIDHTTFRFALHGASTTHRFVWTGKQVAFQSLAGHRDEDADDRPDEIKRWVYAPEDVRLIPQNPTPVNLNLWLFKGQAPLDNREVEIIIRQFSFRRLAEGLGGRRETGQR